MVEEKKIYSRRARNGTSANTDIEKELNEVPEDSAMDEVSEANNLKVEDGQKKDRNFLAYIILTQISLIISLSFHSFPLLNDFYAGKKASLNVYSGFAMNNGQVPYDNFYSSDGPILFFINELGNKFGSTWILWGIEAVNLILISGLIYKMGCKRNLTVNKALSISIVSLLGMGLLLNGGNLAAEFAIYPVLWSVVFIEKIFKNQVNNDKKFIVFGMFQAISMLIVPAALLANIVFFILFVVSFFKNKPLGKQKTYEFIYQLLATIFGFLVIFYLTVYYGLVNQFLSPATEQMFVLPFKSINFNLTLLTNIVITLVLFVLIFGRDFTNTWNASKGGEKENLFYKYLILSSLLFFVITVLSPMYVRGDMLVLLPLLIIPVINKFNQVDGESSFVVKKKISFLPLVGILAILALDVYTQVSNSNMFQEEKRTASYLSERTSRKDKLIILSNDYNIYVESKRLATLPIPLSSYPEKYQLRFDENLPKTESKYIVQKKNYRGVGAKAVKAEIDSFYSLNYVFKSDIFEIYKRTSSTKSLIEGDKVNKKGKVSSDEQIESSSSSSIETIDDENETTQSSTIEPEDSQQVQENNEQ